MILFFDTETTGLPQKGLSLDHPRQPRIVQLAAILTDEEGRELSSINFIIKPDGYEIPDVVANIHGITTEIADRYGVPIEHAMESFLYLQGASYEAVAHNKSFDIMLVESEIARLKKSIIWGTTFCTMEATTSIVKMPPTERMLAAGFTHHKPPKLVEAYRHIFDRELDGAHDALIDVRACKEIYFWLKGHRRIAS